MKGVEPKVETSLWCKGELVVEQQRTVYKGARVRGLVFCQITLTACYMGLSVGIRCARQTRDEGSWQDLSEDR